jgi:hypothetical protein
VEQQAMQLQVAEVGTGQVMWDSGKVRTAESRHIVFNTVGDKVGRWF